MSFKGYASHLKPQTTDTIGFNEFATVEPIRLEQAGLSVLAHMFARVVGTDAAEAGSEERDILATAHAALKGDIIRVTSGAAAGRETKVTKTADDHIYIADAIALEDTDTFEILRHKYPTVGADGVIPVSATIDQSPIQYDLDGVDTEVKHDTGTPSNSRPLPVRVFDSSGAGVNVATQTTLAALLTELQLKADLSETQPVAVDYSAAEGAGAPAAVAVVGGMNSGGTAVHALQVDNQGHAKVDVQSSALPTGASTETTLAALLTELQLKADLTDTQPVSLASVPLPTGAATSANQSTIIGHVDGIESALSTLNGKDFATQTTLAALLTELQLKADLLETQPVSASQTGNWSVRAQDGSGNALTSEAVGSNRALHTKAQGSAYADSTRYSHGTPVTTSAWTELIASTAAACQGLMLFDSSGETLELGIGAAAAETRTLLIPPGGLNGFIPLRIPAGTRLSVKAVSANTAAGDLVLTLLQ